MNWNVKVITAPSRDSDLSLMVIFDQDKYLINCGEGTQRSCTQRGVGFRKLGTVLLTSSSSDVVGGLPGILMSSADTGIPEIKVAGPEAALQYLVSSRTFCQREKFSVEWLAHPTDPSQVLLEKSHLSVRAIPLSSIDSAPTFPTPRQDWEWRDLDLKLDELSEDQLAGWRRTVLADMFKKNGNLSGRAPGISTSDPSPANDTVPSVLDAIPAIPPSLLASASTSDDHIPKPIRQYHPARMHIPQPIPRPSHSSSSSQTTIADPDLRYAYILQAPPVRGKFDIKKAKALGVPNGPVRKILIEGGQIEVDDAEAEGGKRVIKAEDVLGATQDGGSFIMVDVTVSHLPRLLQDPAFKEYQSTVSDAAPSKQARLVVHRITDEVMRDERYMAWVRSFGKDTNHVLANVDRFVDSVTYTSSARNLLKLNILDKDIFQLVHIEDKGDQSMKQDDSPFVPAQPHMFTRIFPSSPPQVIVLGESDPGYPAVQELDSAQKLVMDEMPEYADLVKKAWEKTAALEETMTVEDDFGMVVTPLGTGSAIPSKYRNVSATIVEIPDFGNILLDAGEGTLGQMHRRYGSELWSQVLSKTKIMVISHMHADHHIGLRRVLEERLKHNPTETLYIIAPSFIALHLIENGMSLDDESHKICFIDTYHLTNGVRPNSRSPSPTPSPERSAGRFEAVSPSKRRKSARQEAFHRARDCLRDLDLECIQTPEVEHRGRAYGFALTHRLGWKIVYSGDTMPCDELVEAGQGATLLIHEATLDDDNVVMAVMKGHSTFGQAVEVGKRMGAKYILLNHFSQRYPKLPRYQPAPGMGLEDASSGEPKIALAFDLMTLPLKAFDKATSYTDAMEVLFKEDEAEEEEVVDEEAQDNNEKPKAQNKQVKGGGQKKQTGQHANGAQTIASGELSQNQQKKQDRKEHRSQQKKAAIALAAGALPEPEVISAAAGLPAIAQDSVSAVSEGNIAARPVGDLPNSPSAETASGNSKMTGIISASNKLQEGIDAASGATGSHATESTITETTLVNEEQNADSSPVTGEKRQNQGEDVDMERGPIKRTKSETTGVTFDAA